MDSQPKLTLVPEVDPSALDTFGQELVQAKVIAEATPANQMAAAAHAAGQPLVVAQLGGCNLTEIRKLLPNAVAGPLVLRSSTASLVADPLHYSVFRFTRCADKSRYMFGDFNKEFFRSLNRDRWDVLLLDFVRDIFTGSVRTCGTYVTEMNEFIHGEPCDLSDVFLEPYEIIDWKHPDFESIWKHSLHALMDQCLIPSLNAGKSVVLHELYPANEKIDRSAIIQLDPSDADHIAIKSQLARMYDYAAQFDARIIRIRVEEEYNFSTYDSPNGLGDMHKVREYSVRAAEIACEGLGILDPESRRHFASARLQIARARYLEGIETHHSIHAVMGSLQEERDALAASLSRIRSERNSTAAAYERRLAESEHAFDSLSSQFAEMSRKRAEAELLASTRAAEVALMTVQVATLSGETETGRDLAEKLTRQLAAAEMKAVQLEAISADLAAELDMARKSGADAVADLAQFHEAVEASARESADKVAALSVTIASLSEEVESAQGLATRLSMAEDRLAAMETAESALRAELSGLQAEYDAYRAESDANAANAAAALAARTEENLRLNSRLSDADRDLTQCQMVLADIATQFAERAAERDADSQSYRSQVTNLKDLSQRLAAELEAAQALATASNDESRRLRLANGDLAETIEREAAVHAARLSRAEEEAQGLAGQLEDLRLRHAALESAVQSASVERDLLTARVEALLKSTSWRLTAPLRSAKSIWLRLRR